MSNPQSANELAPQVLDKNFIHAVTLAALQKAYDKYAVPRSAAHVLIQEMILQAFLDRCHEHTCNGRCYAVKAVCEEAADGE
jgi:hypothetical protein